MNGWVYGLVRVNMAEGNYMVLAEIYFDEKEYKEKGKAMFFTPLQLDELMNQKGVNEIMIDDLSTQIKTRQYWRYPEDFIKIKGDKNA